MKDRRKRILVAEDNLALASVLRFNLQRAGYEVAAARDGQSAFEAAVQTEFDMVISDQQMPQMTGIELCEKLRQTPGYEHTPFMLLTAKAMELDADDLRESHGICQLIPKPFSPLGIVREVEEALLVS